MRNLKYKWGSFLTIALGPGSVIFVILTVISLFAAFYFQGNKEMSALLSVIGSIFGSISGSFIRDDYSKISGESILEKKGLSAIRNLRSIEMQLNNIQIWIRGFLKEKIAKEQKNILNEIDRHISTTKLNIQSGFSDWTDMVPELVQEAGYIAEINKKQQEVFRVYVNELLDKKKELISSSDEKRVEELKKRISILEKQIKDIKSDNSHSIDVSVPFASVDNIGVGPLTASHVGLNIANYSTSLDINSRCGNCGKKLDTYTGIKLGTPSIYDSYCKECKNKLFGI